MRTVSVFLLAFVIGLSGAQQRPGLTANANANRNVATGQASSNQQQSGRGVQVGGSAGVKADVSADGSSSADAQASGGGSADNATTEASVTDQGSSTEAVTGAPEPEPATPAVPPQPTTSQSLQGNGQGLGQPTPSGSAGNGLVGGGPVQTGVVYPPIVEGGNPAPQVPGVWDALDALRGKATLTAEEIQAILATAQPDQDYPVLAEIPNQTGFSCAKVKQAGFYADTDSRCQVFRRCDIDGVETSYLCPNKTVFNQIVLVCDWFFNVNCPNSAQYYDYSNSRLYHASWVLLDTPPEKIIADAEAAIASVEQPKPAPKLVLQPAKTVPKTGSVSVVAARPPVVQVPAGRNRPQQGR